MLIKAKKETAMHYYGKIYAHGSREDTLDPI